MGLPQQQNERFGRKAEPLIFPVCTDTGCACYSLKSHMLDDLGAERNTSFGKERVFEVVDKRLLSGKPMIVTTNIPLSVMKQAANLDDRRIFDRILEVCVPIMFDGDSFHKTLPPTI